MVSPGYPQMGQMPPMGGPTGPMAPAPRPVRRGTSKVVPVVVSAGLAIGVFCGLLFGLGTGKKEADADPAGSAKTAAAQDPKGSAADDTPTPATPESKGNLLDPSKVPAAKPATAAGSGSAAPAAGSAAGSAAVAKAQPATVKLTVQITPDAAAKSAKIVVDGKPITGDSVDLPAGTKSVKVDITSPGYHSQTAKVDMSGGDSTLQLEMIKRAAAPASGGSTGGSHPSGGSGHKKPTGGGLIDI